MHRRIRPAALLMLLLLPGKGAAMPSAGEKGDGSPPMPRLERVGTYQCGRQPKQVVFSPDGKYVVMPLLDDDGFDVFSVEDGRMLTRVSPPGSGKKGFAEGLFIPEEGVFLVSQMTTAQIHVYSYPGFSFMRTLETGGTWSKFMAWSPQKRLVAVSNWVSDDISLISWDTGEIERTIPTASEPRGLVFTDGGGTLISLSFGGGMIERFSVDDGKRTACISIPDAAMRHIVLDSGEQFAYVSDMYHRAVYRISLRTFTVDSSCRVFSNPNTIALFDDQWLFVSSRGPNDSTDYTRRSPVNGRIQTVRTGTMEVESALEGGNQPTGLAVSPGGTLLCFSNFQDATIEIFRITSF